MQVLAFQDWAHGSCPHERSRCEALAPSLPNLFEELTMNGTIATPRLLLRRWKANDLAEMFGIYADRETMRWFGAGSIFSRAQIADSLVNVIAEYAFLQENVAIMSAVVHHENRAAIALCKRLGMSFVGKRLRFGFNSVLYQVSAETFLERFGAIDGKSDA